MINREGKGCLYGKATVQSMLRGLIALPVLVFVTVLAALAWAGGGMLHSEGLQVRGADLSFTLQEEAAGNTFSDRGTTEPIERILAHRGGNYVRLRVWVDPPAGYSNEESALKLARRAHKAGMKILLNLHYSDFWADHGRQDIPVKWQGQDLPSLATTVRDYTRRVVAAFVNQGTPVDMIEIGNEITYGMLWPLGQIYQADGEHWSEFVTLVQAGIAGARGGALSHHAPKIMIHVHSGGDNGGSRHFYDHLLGQGVQFDVIGLSYYPFWNGSLANLRDNLVDLATRYNKSIIIAETSYPWTFDNGDELQNIVVNENQLPNAAVHPATPEGQAAYYEALRSVLQQVPYGHGTGFFVWEPGWIPGVGWGPGSGNQCDNLTMFDWRGAALPALKAFRPTGR